MIDPRIAWFAIGATSSAMLFGWPWHPRFSRYSRRSGNGNCVPLPPAPPLVGHHRWFINNPVQIAECGGPCSAGPSHCDCGALWVDVARSLGEPWEKGPAQRGNSTGEITHEQWVAARDLMNKHTNPN